MESGPLNVMSSVGGVDASPYHYLQQLPATEIASHPLSLTWFVYLSDILLTIDWVH